MSVFNEKDELATANKLLARIATICTGALDPELTREQVIGRVFEEHREAVSPSSPG